MQFLKNPLFFIIITASIFFITSESISYFDELENAKLQLYKKNRLILKNLTDAQAKNVQILAEVLSVDESIIQGYRENNPEIIKEHVMPLWKKVKDSKLTYEIHFFKPPAISFVNFSNFKSLGKDVSDVRTDIEWVTSSFQPSSHALMCKTYAGYRATHPIYDRNGTLLGGLSLGKKIDWIPVATKKKTELDAFLVYKKGATNSLAPKYYNSFMNNKELAGEYIFADATFDMNSTLVSSIDFTKDIQELTLRGEEYTLFSYPIVDFNKETMGYICMVSKLQEFKEDFILSAFQSFMIVIVSALIVLLLTRNRILSLFREIASLKNITKKIQKREFSALHDTRLFSGISTDSLIKLQNSIVEMGLELEKQYVELENDNRVKSKKLIEQLYRDELTGLGNRAALFRDLRQRSGSYLAILNIRNFKEVNDAFGFIAGSSILKELAYAFKRALKGKGFSVYRVGNDEYVLTRYSEKSGLEFKNYVTGIMKEMERRPFFILNDGADIEINIDIYAGICFEKEQSLEKAGMALTHAKKHKKEFSIYTSKENTQSKHLANIAMMNKLTRAFENDDILVFYQAIVNANREIVKHEALVRMRDEEKILSPFMFLEISKQTKHYSEITKVVIEKTFAMLKKRGGRFSINLTADDILNSETMSLIDSKLQECLDPSSIVFELVESDDLYNLDEIQVFIKEMKRKGAQIAIDDFGTGYSNFSYMLKIEPDYLKLDGSLIKNLDSDESAKKIVRTIINFANELGIKTIAEFVHSEEIFEICKELGIDEFQGFYFSEPAPL